MNPSSLPRPGLARRVVLCASPLVALALGGCANAPLWGPWSNGPSQAEVIAAVRDSDQRYGEPPPRAPNAAPADATATAEESRPLRPPTRPGSTRSVDVLLQPPP